ncbi:MAG: hypothetical protein KGH64_06125 [Candidatus Micrarchaeota archaeon]|nr:hypothetical protein [Candidatus Micrarchaeota archaeon]MDE1860069.1 hypothetical protein [Candidatus Micrarchaeota archaeon]
MGASKNKASEVRRIDKRDLEAFRIKARRAKRLSDVWRDALNEWLSVAEHGKNLGEIKRLGRKEYLLRKSANRATEEMYKAWQKSQGN